MNQEFEMTNDLLLYTIPITTTLISVIVGLVNIIYHKKIVKAEIEKMQADISDNILFKSLYSTIVDSKELDNEVIYKNVNNVNSEIKYIFDKLTNSNCRTTIRVIIYDEKIPMVASLISQSLNEETKHETKFYKIKLFEDTSISYYISKDKEYFLDNDLSEIHTFLPAMPKSNKDYTHWNFAYCSSLVVPIRKKEDELEHDLFYGLLCIDSDKKSAFNKEIHIDIAKKIVTDLTPFFDKWTRRMIENNNKLSSAID